MPISPADKSRADPRDPAPSARFYFTGGTVPTDASSYVTRQADTDLIERLRAGDFCYVLNSRQMGKSSLMVRTAIQLRSEGVAVAVIDLTSIGQNLNAEQWYGGILSAIGLDLDIEDEIDDFLEENRSAGPLQRFLSAVRQVVLPLMGTRPVVLFVDEIDAVRSLSFSTDEFFAATRECYNRRTTDPDMRRLTFCLLGVATPADLIRDVRTTPFNIGRRVELTDFTAHEAAPLAQGMTGPTRNGRLLLKRVLYWTNGHPYLTQRLCQAIASERSILSPFQVDRLVGALFLSKKARETDDNLAFVRNRMLKSEVDLFDLLDLYTRIWRRMRLQIDTEEAIRTDDSNPLVAVLLLAGVVRLSGNLDGSLRIRNRIYRTVFDPTWAETSLPDGALRRERIAVGRARIQVASIAACIVMLIASLAVVAVRGRADAKAMKENAERLLYIADMNLAQQAWATDNVPRVLELLKQVKTSAKPGFEWNYLNRLCNVEQWCMSAVPAPQLPPQSRDLADILYGEPPIQTQILPHAPQVTALAFVPGGMKVCFGLKDGNFRVCDARSTTEVSKIKAHSATLLRYSPDGRLLFVDGQIYGTANGAIERTAPEGFNAGAMDCSWDMSRFVSWTKGMGLVVWDAMTGKQVAQIPAGRDGINCLALSPNGRLLAVATGDGYAEIWDTTTHQKLQVVHVDDRDVSYAAFVGNTGNLLTISSRDATKESLAEMWDVKSGSRLQESNVSGGLFALSPDGKSLAGANGRGTVFVWSIGHLGSRIEIRGNKSSVSALCFSPDGRSIATASSDNLIKVWDSRDNGVTETLSNAEMGAKADDTTIIAATAHPTVLSPDGRTIVNCGSEPRIFVTSGTAAKSGSEPRAGSFSVEQAVPLRATLPGVSLPAGSSDQSSDAKIVSADFSPDGTKIVTGTKGGAVTVWNAVTGESTLPLLGHSAKILSATYSPDGARIVTSSADRTVRLWESLTGQQIYSFDIPPGQPDRIALFSDDGSALILAKTDPTDSVGTIVYSSKSADRRVLASLARNAIQSYKRRHLEWNITTQ